jgi:proteic killer suppression protein
MGDLSAQRLGRFCGFDMQLSRPNPIHPCKFVTAGAFGRCCNIYILVSYFECVVSVWRYRSIPVWPSYLELAFSKKSLREICESQLRAEQTLGIAVARLLRARLADLREADTVDDLVAGPPKKLDSTPPGRIAIPLGDGMFICFCSNHAATPLKKSGEVNWVRVNRIKIVEIGATND